MSIEHSANALDRRTVNDDCLVNTVRGILQAACFRDLVAQLPCDVVGTLTADASTALKFVAEVQAGLGVAVGGGFDIGAGLGAGFQLPSILTDANVPLQVCTPFVEAVGCVVGLPAEILNEIGLTVGGVLSFLANIEARVDVSGLLNGILGEALNGILGGGLGAGAGISASLGTASVNIGGILATVSAQFGGALGGGVTATCAKTTYAASPSGGQVGGGATATVSLGSESSFTAGVHGTLTGAATLSAGATATSPSESWSAGESGAPGYPPASGSLVHGISGSGAPGYSAASSSVGGVISGSVVTATTGFGTGLTTATGYPGESPACNANSTTCVPSEPGFSGVPSTGGTTSVHMGYGLHAVVMGACAMAFGGMILL